MVTIHSNAGNFSSTDPGSEVFGRRLAKPLLEAFGKIGGAAKAGFIGNLGDIAGLFVQEAQGLVQPVFLYKGDGRLARQQKHLAIQLGLAVAHGFVEIIDF